MRVSDDKRAKHENYIDISQTHEHSQLLIEDLNKSQENKDFYGLPSQKYRKDNFLHNVTEEQSELSSHLSSQR